jgi:hypothetical protein
MHTAVKNRPIRLPLVDPADTTGLVIGDFTIVAASGAAYLATPIADLSLVLDEVDDVNAQGYYELSVTPTVTGLVYIRLERGADTFEYELQVQHEGIDLIGAQLYGAEGDYTITVEDAGGVVEGAVVRVLNPLTNELVGRGTSDAAGEVTFGLPVGTYSVRISKDGHDFSAVNPTSVTVSANDEVIPQLDGVLPSSASLGDQVTLYGRFFGTASVEAVFGTETPVAVDSINAAGTVAIATIPMTLTDTIVPVRIQKPDPNDPPDGVLTSDIATLEIV